MAQKIIVTIGREFGTGGRRVAVELAEMLNIKLYDRTLLKQFEERYHLTSEEIDRIKAQKKSWWTDFNLFYSQRHVWKESPAGVSEETITSERLYQDEEFLLRTLAEQESCVILGRTGFHIFRDMPNAFKVFLVADKATRRDRVARRLNINEGSADALINKVDEARENFTKTFSGKSRYDVRNYDLVLNVRDLEPKDVARFIADCIRQRQQ
ncbi:MAG: cytidylate kinase-like family protein [Paludibacteraceae bacterium]|nr:cytidylate kinase-like family protein [Paludibacteraceae bacterium]